MSSVLVRLAMFTDEAITGFITRKTTRATIYYELRERLGVPAEG